MNCDVSFVFSGPINFRSWNKTFEFDDNLLKSLTVVFDFRSDSVNSVIYLLFRVHIHTALDITFENILTLFLRFILFHFKATES